MTNKNTTATNLMSQIQQHNVSKVTQCHGDNSFLSMYKSLVLLQKLTETFKATMHLLDQWLAVINICTQNVNKYYYHWR